VLERGEDDEEERAAVAHLGWPYAVTMSHASRSIPPQGTPLPPMPVRG
jgi:hypothetical protein